MQIPILSGIYTDASRPEFRVAYPRNMVPVPVPQGISQGYLRPSEGIETLSDAAPGPDRGGVVWNGQLFRVMGNQLCRVDANVVVPLGPVDGAGWVSLDYSFDRLGFASGGQLWYSLGGAPFPVTDPDTGSVIDALFLAGYWIFTDGSFIAVTDLADPMSVNPLRYGASEVDPDPIVALRKIRDEFYAINRHSIEGFRNVGGSGFPWQVIQGSQIMRGAVSRTAVCVLEDAIAFVGGGRNEGISVYVGKDGSSASISTSEIDTELERYSAGDIASIVLETRICRGHFFLYMHLPDKTLVYDVSATTALKEPVWHTLTSGLTPGRFKAWGFCLRGNDWIVGDPTSGRVGRLTQETASHWGEASSWEFAVPVLYNEGNPAIVHELELVALPGRVDLGDDPRVSVSHSADGVVWSDERYISVGKIGDRTKRIVWFGQGLVSHWRTTRFRGTSDARLAFARLEARVEPLNRKRGAADA